MPGSKSVPLWVLSVLSALAMLFPSPSKASTTFAAFGPSLGAIPDSDVEVPACQNNSTTHLDVQFNVSGMSGTLLETTLNFNASHNFLQDLEVTLISPGGQRSHLLFAATGTTSTTPNNCGDYSWGANSHLDSANTIYFNDNANLNWWNVSKSSPVPSSSSRTVVTGIGGVTSPPPAVTGLSAAFRGLTDDQINGTWTLRFRDRGFGDTGSVAAANLTLTTTGHDADAATLGAIPDSDVSNPVCQNDSTTYRDIEFPISGQSGILQSVAVDFSASHPWLQDLEVTLISPGGTRSLLLFSATGTTTSTPNSCTGSTSDLSSSNVYRFSDKAAANWWTTASTNIVVPSSLNRTVVTGIGGASNPPPTTSLDATFAGLKSSQVNGTWKLRFRDRGFGGTGNVTAAHLSLIMSIFASDFENQTTCNWSATPEICD